MVVKKLYMISWFNNNAIRKTYFKKNIALYTKLGYEIEILWMNNHDEKIFQDNIKYIDSEITNASVARNKLLKLFYNSSFTECLFSDDDTIILDPSILDVALNNNSLISFIPNKDRILRGTVKPFNAGLFKMKNFKEKVFFDETLLSNQDFDFGINLYYHNIEFDFITTNKVKNDQKNSIMFKDEQDRKNKKNTTRELIINKWKNYADQLSTTSL